METAGTIKVRYHKGPVPVWQETLASFFLFGNIFFIDFTKNKQRTIFPISGYEGTTNTRGGSLGIYLFRK